jgi:membrane protein
MEHLWSRGGLSWYELGRRVWRESAEDEVFGMAARLAFYHFLAFFPVLLLFLALIVHLAGTGKQIQDTLTDSLNQLLPGQSFTLVQSILEGFKQAVRARAGVWAAILGAVWASVNGTWAMMTGLNMAYEVKEDRPLWKRTLLALALTITLATMGVTALLLILYGSRIGHLVWHQSPAHDVIWRLVQWAVICGLLLTAFAVLYRFAPNMKDRQWQWSTPGAVIALFLWTGCAVLLRVYFEHTHSYERLYGPLANVAMLLMWLYLTSASILIGGEMNSEIEKAATGRPDGHPGAEEARKGAVAQAR